MGIFGTGTSEQSRRDDLQNLFDRSFKRDDAECVRKHYRTLRQLEMDTEKVGGEEIIDISYLTENITVACDIITSETDKNFVFCGNDTAPIKGNMRLISKALLNLLSNAYLYSVENLIITKTVELGEFVKIEVHSGGIFRFNNMEKGGGLRFVREVCNCHGGRFFIQTDRFSSAAVMTLKKSPCMDDSSQSPDFFELLNDRLSPVYVEFFGM